MPMADRSGNWSRYWAGGALHSCPGSFSANYNGAIASFWRRALSDLQSQSQLIDLASGNGSLPRLLMDELPIERLPEIHAVDRACVQPRWPAEYGPAARQRLHFHSGTSIERLPFGDATFTHLVSQYGIEYAERNGAIGELLRVAGPRANIVLVMHHAASRLVEVGRAERQHAEALLADDGLLAAASLVAPYLAMAGNAQGCQQLAIDSAAHAARARYNAVQAKLSMLSRAEPSADLLREAQAVVARIQSLAAIDGGAVTLQRLDRYRQSVQDGRDRLADLIDTALTSAEVQQLVNRLRVANFNVEPPGELHYEGHLMAWTLIARRGDLVGA